MIVLLSLLTAVVGLVLYFIATNAKVAEVGRLAFAVGLLAFLLQVSPKVIDLLPK